jgi:hypothetical protein
MGEMIERVARALNEATELALETHGRFDTRQMARAAIEAMLEPTDLMLTIGCMAAHETMEQTWRAMISEALKEADRSGLGVSRDHDHTAGVKLEGEG